MSEAARPVSIYGVRSLEVFGKSLPAPYVGLYPIFGPVGHFNFEHLHGPLPDQNSLIKPLLD